MVISNACDPAGKRQGWHDKVAQTQVFIVRTGRDPLETRKIAGRESYAPAPMPSLAPVHSPLTAASGQSFGNSPVVANTVVPVPPGRFQHTPARTAAPDRGGAPQTSPFAPPTPPSRGHSAQDSGLIAGVPFSKPATPAPQQNQAQYSPQGGGPGTGPVAGQTALDGDELGETRVRPATPGAGIRLTFNDGRTEDVPPVALIGRNLAGYDGEMIERLVPVRDSSRSVSKTHLHVRAAGEGPWVTDRNSMNGSAITNANGAKSALQGGAPTLAGVGATVHFGDRHFQVGCT